MFHEVPAPAFSDVKALFAQPENGRPFSLPEREFLFTGSGKGSLALILGYLRHTGVLTSKMDEILLPAWLGYWVYNQCTPFAFPARTYSANTKLLLAYHQYGFPQDMDTILDYARERKLVVVEDCAHALCSYYKGQRLGTFSDFALFSFSKFFFCSNMYFIISLTPSK